MNVENEIKAAMDGVDARLKLVRWLVAHWQQLQAMPEGSFSGTSTQVDFDNLSHGDAIKVIRAFGGKWGKKKNYSDQTAVDYERTEKVDGVTIRCWKSCPPPSCKIVEVDEVIPEHVVAAKTIKKRVMVCPGAEPVVLAVANAQAAPF